MSKAVIYRKDYQAPNLTVHSVDLHFTLHPTRTQVISTLDISRHDVNDAGILLDGDSLELVSIKMDGQSLEPSAYVHNAQGLFIQTTPPRFQLEIRTAINPEANTALSGLFVSKGIYCTQCEPHGFRRITFFPDHPDVLTLFTTQIVVEEGDNCPVLLSNGNLIETRAGYAHWQDPFPKPSYLFALVAGRLGVIQDNFTTASGKQVDLFIYCEPGKESKCLSAMQALKKSMRWDEQVYGREYDLQRFMIVAVSDFNMGAMENKGLNIFNDKYILADSETATDTDYQNIDAVVAHEYFHNWTGNRVTCRDWFQLSLKEGLTVFRDQEFSRDMHGRDVVRIRDVNTLRNFQFPEDAGPMAHPVRPDSYIEINNFYTTTVYNKGAELVRMLHTLLGEAGFRRGMDYYFLQFDGRAVTIDDFVQSMSVANDRDFTQFKLWYSHSGTPTISLYTEYDANSQQYTITLEQSSPVRHIPLALALLTPDGTMIENTEQVLELTEQQQSIKIASPVKPVLSVLRGFSAPVKIQYERSDEELLLLLQCDTDGFSRWEAWQTLVCRNVLTLVKNYQQHLPLELPSVLVTAFGAVLHDDNADSALRAELLQMPTLPYLAEQEREIDVEALTRVHRYVHVQLAAEYRGELLALMAKQHHVPYTYDGKAVGARRLKNTCLQYLSYLNEGPLNALFYDHFRQADNMTDYLAAITALNDTDCDERTKAFNDFYQRFKSESLVMDKWLSLEARRDAMGTLDRIAALASDPVFDSKNPNKIRALYGSFSQGNWSQFHRADGAGYRFIADQILALDAKNPQIAAGLVKCFAQWRRHLAPRAELMSKELTRIRAQATISKDVYEIVEKCLREP